MTTKNETTPDLTPNDKQSTPPATTTTTTAFARSTDSLYIDEPPPVFWHIKDNHRIRACIIFFSRPLVTM